MLLVFPLAAGLSRVVLFSLPSSFAAALCSVLFGACVLPDCPALPPPPLLLPLLSGCAVRPVVLCCALLCVWCCAALRWWSCVLLFVLVCAVAVAWWCGAFLFAVLFPLAFCGAVVLPCCVVWCVLVPWCPVLCPVVLCCFALLCCMGVLCFLFAVCGCFAHFFLQKSPLFLSFFAFFLFSSENLKCLLKIGKIRHYTSHTPHACSKTIAVNLRVAGRSWRWRRVG